MASSHSEPEHQDLPVRDKTIAKQTPRLLYYGYDDSQQLYSYESLPSREEHILNDLKERSGLPSYLLKMRMPLMLSPGEKIPPCRETPGEFEDINAYFSSQIHTLFNAIKAYQESSIEVNGRPSQQDGAYLGIDVEHQSYDIYPECMHRDFLPRRLHLTDAATLPLLPHVTEFELGTLSSYSSEHLRPVSLRTIVECMVRLPDLQEVNCPWLWERTLIAYNSPFLRTYTREWEGPWRDSRHGFGQALDELREQIPVSLRKVKFRFWLERYKFWDDQAVSMPNLVHPAVEDPVSAGFCIMAPCLEDLDLRAFLTPGLFQAQWPRMRRLRVEFHPCRPDGRWYFVGPRGENPNPDGYEVTEEHYPPTGPNEADEQFDEGWEDNWVRGDEFQQDMFRTEPLAEQIDPLLSAFAAALKSMPVLEEAELFTHVSWNPSPERLEEYGDEAPYDAEYGGRRWGLKYIPGKDGVEGLVEWEVGAWRPPQGVVKLFEDLGVDGRVKMVWKEFEFLDWNGDKRR
ncbi:hypothetical protein B0T10DRAFT_480670 [Thelonectria olida]|uniref:Uncharacterized protein n=1 Tax=Thelonectria olida TaxID=1576542 RepID=A0A9P9ATN5_9HYPO|nr:hypothetical protein B0T10DRAFT_480670 [Thelonectria olida]